MRRSAGSGPAARRRGWKAGQIGIPGGCGGYRVAADRDRLVEVGQGPGPPEPGQQGVAEIALQRGPVEVSGGCGGYRVAADRDRLVEVGQRAGPLEPLPQGVAQVVEPTGTVRMAGRAMPSCSRRMRIVSSRSARRPVRS